MKAKSFLRKFFWLIFAGLAVVHIFTVLVDPYQKAGFNAVNTVETSTERFKRIKNLNAKVSDSEFFIIGSSRAANFNTVSVEKFTGQRTFIYNRNGASLEDYIAVVNHIMQIGKARTIYLQLDFFSFKNSYSTANRIINTYLEEYLSPYIDLKEYNLRHFLFFEKTYFSIRAFSDAFKILKIYLANRWKQYSTPEAIRTPLKEVKPNNKRVQFLKGYFINQYDEFSINEPKLKKWLGFIKKMTTENNIKLIVAMSPMNKQHLERLQMDVELTKHWLEVKRIIADVFVSYYDFNNCSTNSFRGSFYWNDSVHPSKELAAIMLQVLLDQPDRENIPESFGIQVTPETFDDYLLTLNEL